MHCPSSSPPRRARFADGLDWGAATFSVNCSRAPSAGNCGSDQVLTFVPWVIVTNDVNLIHYSDSLSIAKVLVFPFGTAAIAAAYGGTCGAYGRGARRSAAQLVRSEGLHGRLQYALPALLPGLPHGLGPAETASPLRRVLIAVIPVLLILIDMTHVRVKRIAVGGHPTLPIGMGSAT